MGGEQQAQQESPDAAARLARLFRPASVVLVGATDRSQWSIYTYDNLRTYSPHIAVHLVHPTQAVVHGQPAVPRVGAIGEPVDLAYVMVPTQAVLGVCGEIADAGIRNIVVLTAGFAEAGAAGADLQRRLVDLAHRRDLAILGPNGNGFINVAAGAAPYGLPIAPPLVGGPVGIVLQSGGLASSVLAAAQGGGVGISLLCSTGNEAMVSATDIMRYLVADEPTRVIAVFLESIRQPQEFWEVAQLALEAGKPIVAVKVGRSEAGVRTALAHTGALAGDDRVIDAAFRQLGIVRVDSLEEMLSTAGFLGYHPEVRGRRIAAVTPSGGACDLLADRASAEGLELPEFDKRTLEELTDFLPAYSNPHNPLDVTGYVVVDPRLALQALDIVGRGAPDRYDMILYATTLPRAAPADPRPVEARLDALTAARRRLPLPLLLQTAVAADLSPFAQELLAERGRYVLNGIELGTRAIGHAARYHERRDQWRAATRGVPARAVERPDGATGIWSEHRVRDLLTRHGIPTAPARLVTSAAEAADAAGAIGGPVAMKIASAQVPHKSEVGGVRLNVAPEQAGTVFSELAAALQQVRPDATLDGVLIGPMRAGGLELLVGVVADPAWGLVLSVGLGGVWVEVLGDLALRVLPVSRTDIRAMLDELRGAPLLHGARGTRPADIDRVVEVIDAVARLAEGLGPALDTLEINPMRVDGDVIEVLDALAVWRSQPDATLPDGPAPPHLQGGPT
jgi:acyl-CoA synthetase (NDP forming)